MIIQVAPFAGSVSGAWVVEQHGTVVDADEALLRWHLKPLADLLAWLQACNIPYTQEQ